MRQALIFTEEQKNKITDYYTNGDSSTTIINKLKEQDSSFNCSKQVMNRFIESLNITRKSKRKPTVIDDELINNILGQGLIYGKTVKQICSMYNVSPNTVVKILDQHKDKLTPREMINLKWRTLWNGFDSDINLVRCNDEYLDELYNKLQIKFKESDANIHIEKKAVLNYEGKSLIIDLYCPEANVYFSYAGDEHPREDKVNWVQYYSCVNFINLNEGGHNLSDCLDYMKRIDLDSEQDKIIKFGEYRDDEIDELVDEMYEFLSEKITMMF